MTRSANAIHIWANNNVTIEHNHILNIGGIGIQVCGYFNFTGIRILENNITNITEKGINYCRAITGGLIYGNIITDCGESAIITSVPYSNISNNVIHNCNTILPYNDSKGWAHSYGTIHVDWNTADGYANHSVVEGNTISDSIYGITIWANDTTITNNEIYDMGKTYFEEYQNPFDVSFTHKNFAIGVGSWWNPHILEGDIKDPEGVVINNNNFHDNYWNIFHDDVLHDLVEVVNATNNWWGSAIPNASKISDNVTYYPFCVSAECSENIDDEIAGFTGDDTTNFSAITNWSSVDLVLDADDGLINWTSNVNLTCSCLKFSDCVAVAHNRILVDTSAMPELNAPATLTFRDTGYTDLYLFTVYRNGFPCPSSICSNLQLQNGNLNVDVTQMSVYSLEEAAIYRTLTQTGSGLGGFITAITDPVVSIVLALGIIGGILAIFYAIAMAIRNAVSGATSKIGG